MTNPTVRLFRRYDSSDREKWGAGRSLVLDAGTKMKLSLDFLFKVCYALFHRDYTCSQRVPFSENTLSRQAYPMGPKQAYQVYSTL